MNRYILTTYNITDTITVNGYYTFTNIQINIVLDWLINLQNLIILPIQLH